jgi:hypothetical protein
MALLPDPASSLHPERVQRRLGRRKRPYRCLLGIASFPPLDSSWFPLVACSVGPTLHLAFSATSDPVHSLRAPTCYDTNTTYLGVHGGSRLTFRIESTWITTRCRTPVSSNFWARCANPDCQTVEPHERPAAYSSGTNDRTPSPSPLHQTVRNASGNDITHSPADALLMERSGDKPRERPDALHSCRH